MKMNKKLLTIIMGLLSVPIFAQRITIQEASEMALKNNKSIKIQMLEVEKNKTVLDKAWKNAFFTVNYSASAGRYVKEIGNVNNTYGQTISLVQPIYTGGAIKSGIEIGKENLGLEQLKLTKEKNDTLLNTIQAYINVYDGENNLEVYKNSKLALEENYKQQKAKYDLKMVTKPEFLESERSLKAMEATIVDQEATVKMAKETLGNLIGVEGENIEIVPFDMVENFSSTIKLDDDLKKLQEKNTSYLMAVKGKNIAKENINVERADLMPKVSGTVNYGVSNESKFSELRKKENYNGTVGLNVSWTVFDWGANKLDVKNAKTSYEIADLQAEQVLDNLKVNLRNVYYKLQGVEKSLEALEIAVNAAEETYKLEKERYNFRLITLNDFLRAESNLRQAKTNYLSAKLNYYYLVAQYASLLQ